MEENAFLIEAGTGRGVTLGDIWQTASWIENFSASRVGGKRTVVALAVTDRITAAKWIMAGLLCDVVVNPINPELPQPQIEALCNASPASVLVSDMPALSLHSGIAVVSSYLTDEEDKARPRQIIIGDLLIFTSGTTGKPKGVVVTASMLNANVDTAITSFGYRARWKTASLLPLFHTFTIVSDLLTMWMAGGSCVVCPGFSVNTIRTVIAAMRVNRVKSYSGVPIIFQMMTRFGAGMLSDSLQFAVAGAAPLSEQSRSAYLESLKHPIIPCYGLTETTCFLAISPKEKIKPSSVGKPANVAVRIWKENPETDRYGEILVKGASVIKSGYLGQEQSDADQCYVDGFFRTGDIGWQDEEGYLYITGRKKNMVIKGGEKYYLEEIDALLLRQKHVRDCASVVLHHTERDDEYISFVVSEAENGAVDLPGLRATIVEAFGPKAAPREIRPVAQIPRTPTGKPKLAELAAMAAAMVEGAT